MRPLLRPRLIHAPISTIPTTTPAISASPKSTSSLMVFDGARSTPQPARRAPRRPLPRGAGRAGRRVLHSGRVEGRAPAALIVLSELEILAPAVHADGNVADAGPGVEPGAQRPERAVVRGHRASREPNGRPEEPTALVEHAYSMIRSARPSTDCGIVSPSALAVFILITSSNFVGCSIGRSAGFAPLRILST